MQGQRGTVGSFPESFNFDHGSSSGNTAMDPQICWNNMRNPVEERLPGYILPGDANITYVNPARQNMNGWRIGEPSSTNTQQDANLDEPKGDCGWPTSVDACAGIGSDPDPRVEQRQYGPTNILSLDNANANTLLVQGPNSATDPQSLNLNAAIASHGVNNCQVMECHNLFKSSRPENEQISPADGSDPFLPHPGRGGFLVEENDERAGTSLEARRVSCKRKAVEGTAGQSSVGGSGSYFQCAGSSMWPPAPLRGNLSIVAPSELLNPRLGLGVRGISSDSCPDWSTIGNAESSHRNFRLRANPSNQDSVTHSFSSANAVEHPSGSSSQRLPRLPVNHSLDFRSATVVDNINSQNQSAGIHVQALPQNGQPFRWNGSAGSSNSSVPGDRDIVPQEESWPRNMPRHILEHPIFIQAPELRSLAHNPINTSVTDGNTRVTGDVASASGTGSSFVMRPSTATSWAPDYNPPSRYPRRLSEYVRRSLLSSVGSEHAGHSGNHSSLRSASSQDVARPSGAGNPAHHHHPYARLASLAERQGDGIVGFPRSLRTLASASEGRRRLASELRNILDLMRRGEGLRFEDVMLLNQSVYLGVSDIHDRHRDMRLDVDNMSYEELLALEDRIGNVSTGLKEETISSHLKQRRYSGAGAQVEAEPCCVCQEEYNEGEEVGTLECGHDFHTECIKQWLMQKNLCPICKMAGLST